MFADDNYRLVNDLKWVTNKKDILLLLEQFNESVLSKPQEISHSSQIENDALMHREDLTFTARGSTLDVRI